MPRAIRLVVTTSALAALVVAIAAAIVAHPARTPLFAAPLPDQIGEVEERLAAWRVPFTPTRRTSWWTPLAAAISC